MRDKLGRWIKGGVSPRKGVKLSKESKRKMSLAKIGYIPWNKGVTGYSTSLKGTGKPKIKKIRNYSRENNPSWKGGITASNRLERNRFKKTMQKLIFERDNYTCQICGIRGVSLQVDHIQSWAEYVELRFSMDNCRTLCQDCHYLITFNKPKPKNIKTWGHNLKTKERKVV